MGGEFLFSPFAITFGIVIVGGFVTALSAFHYRYPDRLAVIPVKRLAAGYAAIVLCCAIVAVFASYMSFDEAILTWHVRPEDYWHVRIRDYFFHFYFMSCVSVCGVALIGTPIVFRLARSGWATIPTVLLASVPISVIIGLLLSAASFWHLGFMIQYVVSQHLFLALGFCLGAGIPWSRHARIGA